MSQSVAQHITSITWRLRHTWGQTWLDLLLNISIDVLDVLQLVDSVVLVSEESFKLKTMC